MNATFQPGQTVWLEIAGERCEIREWIGSGGQGEVYRALMHDQEYALKWYFEKNATKEQREAIDRLVHKGPPNDRFLWPLDLAVCQGIPSFGYLMPLREARFRGLAELMNREVDPTFHTLTTLSLELAESFLELHSEGLCYSDISFSNIFLDPQNGQASICDNDNVAVDGEGMSGVLGTPRFMAPEVVLGTARPTIQTDLYSLGVILFYILMIHHPLEGRRETNFNCLDLEAMQKLYGSEALFVFDPDNDANRPVPGIHDNARLFWDFYPKYLREAFTRAFTVGLRDPGARVRESEWRAIFIRMRDQIVYCPFCNAENFLADEGDMPGDIPEQFCWSCHSVLPVPLRLRIGHQTVVLNPNTALYPHHLDPNRRNDYSEILAEMARHPTRPDVQGLKNLSPQTWISQPPNGVAVEVPQGRSVSLMPGLRIQFGEVESMVF